MSDAAPWLVALLGTLACCWIIMLAGIPLLLGQAIASVCGIGWGCAAIVWSKQR